MELKYIFWISLIAGPYLFIVIMDFLYPADEVDYSPTLPVKDPRKTKEQLIKEARSEKSRNKAKEVIDEHSWTVGKKMI